MIFIRYTILFICLLLSFIGTNTVMAQRKCATEYLDSLMQVRDTSYSKARKNFEQDIRQLKSSKLTTGEDGIITIPVVVHIVHNNEEGMIGGPDNVNITEEQVLSQIAVLNEDFRRKNDDASNTPSYFRPVAADSEIEFCMATRAPDGSTTNGITRHYASGLPYDNSLAANEAIKSHGYWPSDEYMNIWVTDLISPYIGWAQLPSESSLQGLDNEEGGAETDGIVMSHQYFGDQTGTVTNSRYNKGRSCVHEVGHWLGLLHLWHGGGCNSTDYCEDTPTQTSSTSGCANGESSCGSIDMSENYMDYTDDDCMNLFTTNQKERMHRAIEVDPRRQKLRSSKGCCGASNVFPPPYTYQYNDPEDQLPNWTAGSSTEQNEWQQYHYTNGSALQVPLYEVDEGEEVWLTSPFFDLSTTEHPQMDIEFAYSSSANASDQLIIEYDLVCDENWQPLKTLDGNDLRTSETNPELYTPEDQDWQRIFLDLAELGGEQSIRLRIRLASAAEGNFFVNRFKLYKYATSPQASLYPNPNQGHFEVEVIHSNEEQPSFDVYDAYGRHIFSAEGVEITSKIYQLEFESLQDGVYFLRITTGDQSITRRFSVLH